MRSKSIKKHSVFCCNSLQSASVPDAWHPNCYIYYATSAGAHSTKNDISGKQKERHKYVKRKQRP